MAEQIRAEEGAIEKGATAVDNARSGIENRIKDIEAKMAELGSFWRMLGVVLLQCSVAWLVGMLVYQVGGLL